MNKDFFESFEQRKTEFIERTGTPGDEVRAELVLGTGRVLVVDKIVETTDAWLQADVRDAEDEQVSLSVVLPYYQINHVLFEKRKPKMRHAGFSR
jgi:hypothetical protein